MAKKLRDIKKDPEEEEINLKGSDRSDRKPKKPSNFLKKLKNPIKPVRDISGKEEHYIYVKGKNFRPPRFLGNLLKVGIAGFVILLIINTISAYHAGERIKKEIAHQAEEGYSLLTDGPGTKLQFQEGIRAFEEALDNFTKAGTRLWFVGGYRSFYDRGDNMIFAANALLTGGKHLAEAGNYFLEAVEKFNKIPLFFVLQNVGEEDEEIEEFSIASAVEEGLEKIDLAITEVIKASELISRIDEKVFSGEVGARISVAKKQMEEIAETLKETSEHFPALLKLMGHKTPHRYLILFQNNNEIRPTGGFIGSYAIMDISDGKIVNLRVEDVYDIDGSYGGHIEPPEEFLGFVDNWRFRDSNFSPDFSVSGEKAKWFLEKQGGPGVDTVIAINQGLLRPMLEITGPVQVGEFGKLDSQNYNLLLSYVIEGKVWGPEDPKHILKVFVPAFKEAILKEQNIGAVGSNLYRAVQQKHILMYSPDPDIQALFDAAGISGRVRETHEREDYLSVINASVGGTKADKFMEENIRHETYIKEDGTIINDLTIKRSHLWTEDIYYQWRRTLREYGFTEMPDQLIDILGRGRNKVNMRVFVPPGSELLETTDENIITGYDEDLDKAFFLTEMEVLAGEVGVLNLTYKLPFKLDVRKPADVYRIFVQKQPGSRGSILNKIIHADDSLQTLGYFPATARIDAAGRIIFATNLVYDRNFSAIWK